MGELARENRLLRALVDAAAVDEPEAFVSRVLAALVDVTAAEVGYVAVGTTGDGEPVWWRAHGLEPDPAHRLGKALSTGILREALGSGQVVFTRDAPNDARFAPSESVVRLKLRAVLCAPLGGDGVIYLQGQALDVPEQDLLETATRVLRPVVGRVLREAADRAPDPTAVWRSRLDAAGLVGRTPVVATLLERVALAARARVPVLVTGPSGAGKGLVADLIARNSRPAGPLVQVNCANLLPERAIVDLFGARRGAYTGLTTDRPGLVERAHPGGTLFLDEVAELPADAQAQLLLFLQDGRYRWLGETRERRAEVRIVAATHRDLMEAVRAGAFRQDLYYRLNVLQVAVPGLDARRADIPALADALVRRSAERLSVRARPLTTAARIWLAEQSWPGHVRELDSAVLRGLLVADLQGADRIDVVHLRQDLDAAPTWSLPSLAEASRAFKQAYAERVLAACEGNKSEAARRLSIHRGHLYRLLSHEGDTPPEDLSHPGDAQAS